MRVPIFQVDAFTDCVFGGNPAAVCILASPVDENWMQAIAAEMNLSETAFLLPQEGGFQLRWFTPAVEDSLCGHATLASAHILWETNRLRTDETAKFSTKNGLLTARLAGDSIELDLPACPGAPATPPGGAREAIGADWICARRHKNDFLLELASEQALRSLKPDFRVLADLPFDGWIVTAASSSPEFDFVSRYFAPRIGINEDPVSGWAHTCLGPHWKEKTGKSEFTGFQASARGGVVRVRVDGNRTILLGKAVTVFNGELSEKAAPRAD